jgi:hypothetical protein
MPCSPSVLERAATSQYNHGPLQACAEVAAVQSILLFAMVTLLRPKTPDLFYLRNE